MTLPNQSRGLRAHKLFSGRVGGGLTTLRTVLIGLTLGFAIISGADAELTYQSSEKDREMFKQAWRQVNHGQLSKAKPLINGLKTYPLYVYLREKQLRPTLQRRNNEPLKSFLNDFEGAYPAETLRNEWLMWLADTQQWQDFVDYYRPSSNVSLQCHHKTALLEKGAAEALFQQIAPLWTKGKSQPSACDRVFKVFEADPLFDDPTIWRRFRLAISKHEIGLARHLSKKFENEQAVLWANRWLSAHANPQQTLRKKYLSEEPILARDVLFYALKRLTKSNFNAAEKSWARISADGFLNEAELNRGNAILAIAAGKNEHKNQIFYLDQVDNQFADAELEALRLRRGIQLKAWEQLSRWTLQPPRSSKTNALRWRYWRARSAELMGRQDFANQQYAALANERDYYGFLAADKAALAYSFNDVPIKPTPEALQTVTGQAGIQRAKEFFLLGFITDANREWRYTLKDFSKSALEIAALTASKWGWHNRAIATLGQAKSYDDVVVRFPMLFADQIKANSNKRQLEEALIYSIIRTESAFSPSARSSAGALGLMQLMPATGREAGRRIGIRIKKSSQLLAPTTNIAIGTSYLSSLLTKHGGSFPMAAAAYNAGPHRVRQWRPSGNCIDADIWIDSIPFRETRRYVRTTVFYYVIYQHRLGTPIKPVKEMLTRIPPSGGASSCSAL